MPAGDPRHTAGAVLDLVDMDQPPLRLLLGAHVLPLVLDTYNARIQSWHKFKSIAESAQ